MHSSINEFIAEHALMSWDLVAGRLLEIDLENLYLSLFPSFSLFPSCHDK